MKAISSGYADRKTEEMQILEHWTVLDYLRQKIATH